MSGMVQHFINVNGHEHHIRVWNSEASETIFCAHGFTHTGADFIVLGELFAKLGYRVIAPDIIGRGLSQWSIDPQHDYSLQNYAKSIVEILAHYKCDSVHWVGSNMGGLLGILLASEAKYQNMINTLTLNDIGPEIPQDALENMQKKSYEKYFFTQFTHLAKYLEKEYFPECSDKQVWQKVCEASARRLSIGGFTLHYDNHIIKSNTNQAVKLWNRFQKLNLPIMVMHGVNSDMLTKPILYKMREIQKEMVVNYYLGCKHPPNLLNSAFCQDIANFIRLYKQDTVTKKDKALG